MPDKLRWTRQQKDAIESRGGSLLVSAAAGSGKTAVLVERAVGLICDPVTPTDADRLLVVTFSNAAAAELKQRMAVRLAEMLRENPANLFLQRQQALLASAQISTVDSFCLELLRSNFQTLDIPPDFTVADENELALMKSECAAACVESMYVRDESGVFRQLAELLSSGKDDSRLVATVLKIYDFSRSHPFYEDWLDEKERMYDTDIPPSQTVWGQSILRYAEETLLLCKNTEKDALALAQADPALYKAYGEALERDLKQIDICLDAAKIRGWDRLAGLLGGFEFLRLGAVRGDFPAKTAVKDAREKSKEKLRELGGKYLCLTEEDFVRDLKDLRPKITALFALVNVFSRTFSDAKAEKKRLDFSDLEHLALRLLVQKRDGTYARTKRAAEISERYDHVLVDEYQDTNEVQDLIFTCVSRNQENLFMVGDVKQSIYAFRQAMPEIFIAKRQSAFPYSAGIFPAKISLDMNFRSRREVTRAVNFIFGSLMSERLGGVDYDEEESLKCGAEFPEHPGAEPELMLLNAADYDSEKDLTALEAGAVAKKIAHMLDSGYTVYDGGVLRAAEPCDFCVLLRAPKNRAEVYAKALAEHGVPAWTEASGGYLAAREVSSAVSMLKAVDNPLRDIELVAAMMSDFFAFDGDSIANIRMLSPKTSFYAALLAAAGTDKRSAAFLSVLTELRSLAAFTPADRLIMRFYDMTDALRVVRVMKNGEIRVRNLRLLAEYAAEYHRLGYKQLGGFVSLLDRMEENGRDLGPAGLTGDGENAVRIMSAHRSKGLEFPVVILADTGRAFNKTDLRAPSMLHSQYGFACIRRDAERMVQFPTAPLMSVRLESGRAMLSEEMRILYVALTRAKEKLIISACIRQEPQKKLTGLVHGFSVGKLPAAALADASCYADWILAALLRHRSAAALRETAQLHSLETIDDENPWKITILEPEEYGAKHPPSADGTLFTKEGKDFFSGSSAAFENDNAFTGGQIPSLQAMLAERLSFVYPFESATLVPSKLAVSAAAESVETALRHRFTARPRFMSEQRLTPAEKGDAMHRFMQFASYESARDKLESEIKRMEKARYLSPAEAESLDRQKLRAFFTSSLADRIFASADVRRELRFMAECGREILGGIIPEPASDAKIVLQGVADCVFIENGGAVIVDYKTERVKSPDELLERYSGQLGLYRAILGNRLGVPVLQCVIYSFALSREITVM